jgi:hyaluronoglucosaminidase
MYDPGLWPKIDIDEYGKLQYQNGGLPQNGSLDLHLRQLEIDIDRLIPNKSFDGLAVLDFECWRPIFRQNFGDLKIYKDLTLLQINKKHPSWSREQIEAQAKIVFENSAVNFMNRTILRARKLRPKAKVGYYGFPHCFNRYRIFSQLERCPNQVEMENNKLLFLYSNAIYSSIYITKNQTDEKVLAKFVQGKMYETNRMSKLIGGNGSEKLPFIRYQYTDTIEFMKRVEYSQLPVGGWRVSERSNNLFIFTQADMLNILKAIKAEGGDGVIIWGSSSQFKNEAQCRTFKDYFERELLSIIKDFRKLL